MKDEAGRDHANRSPGPDLAAGDRSSSLSPGAAFLLTGVGIGWLMGLSTAPVVASVITALLALAGAAVSVGVTDLAKKEAGPPGSPWPMALLVLGIALGAPAGISARVEFGPAPAPSSSDSGARDEDRRAAASTFGLFADSISPAADCADLLRAPGEELRFRYRSADNVVFRILGETIEEEALLEELRDRLCAPD